MRACAPAQTMKTYGWLDLEALLLRQLEMPHGIVRKRDQIPRVRPSSSTTSTSTRSPDTCTTVPTVPRSHEYDCFIRHMPGAVVITSTRRV